jgi:hypothetical protein
MYDFNHLPGVGKGESAAFERVEHIAEEDQS